MHFNNIFYIKIRFHRLLRLFTNYINVYLIIIPIFLFNILEISKQLGKNMGF